MKRTIHNTSIMTFLQFALPSLLLLLFTLSCFFNLAQGTKHSFTTKNDPRFFIGPIGHPFGYLQDGTFNLTVYDFSIVEKRSQYKSNRNSKKTSWFGRKDDPSPPNPSDNDGPLLYQAGFLLKRFESESDFYRFEESIMENPTNCAFDEFLVWNHDDDDYAWMEEADDVLPPDHKQGKSGWEGQETENGAPTVVDDGIFLSLTAPHRWNKKRGDKGIPTLSHSFSLEEEGLYFLVYQVCPVSATMMFTEVKSTFTLDISHHNYDPFGNVSYLTAGDIPLPLMYFYFTISYSLCVYVWMRYLREVGGDRRGSRGIAIHQIHHLMTVLVYLKAFSLFFESVRFHYIGTTGHAELWSVVYYTFMFLKGVMLFTVILLIGSGWSFVKPFLHDREKKIVFLVLVLQVVDNVAIVVLANETEGERLYEDWSALLHLVDILCCCAVLVPIVWQVNALEQTVSESESPDENDNSEKQVKKLKLFRTFYLLVVVYIYFTRVIVYLFATFLGFRHTWLRYLVTELGTLVFYVVTGYTFRPVEENPYMELMGREEDEDDGEIIEMMEARGGEDKEMKGGEKIS